MDYDGTGSVALSSVRERERERERESAWWFDSVKRITTRRIVCRDIILRHNIMLL